MRGSLQGWILALVATLTMAVSYADRQALAVLAPEVTRALGMSDTVYGWLLSAFSFAYLLGAPLAGAWVDRLGARKSLTRAVLAWSLIAALHALVPSIFALFVLRIALGFAEAPSFPGAAQTVHRVLAPADRPRGFGLLFVGSSIGAMIVPPLATAIDHRFGFRVALLGTAVVALSWLPLWIAVTASEPARRLLDVPQSQPACPSLLSSIRHPALLRGCLVILAVSPMMSYALNWSSKYLVTIFALPMSAVGERLWLPPLLYDLGSIGLGIAAGAQLRRKGPSAGSPLLLVTLSLTLALAVALLPRATDPWTATALLGVAMAGGGGLFALVTADLLARVPQDSVSACAGLCASAQSVAYIAASPLIGWGLQHSGHAATQLGLALWLLPGCLAWLLWTPPPRLHALEQGL